MSYLVLARKWRPRSFADLIGQGHVSRTLQNAIAQGRVAHAFLFTGVRGVGKTTSARILAKALQCDKGPTPEPCLQCAPCLEIAEGSDLDVLEIDGATYTGIDKVRELQESLPYRPARDRFKIAIIDEVHMLSQPAWNAFLKTLEEPPPHVKFIFATTEAHKVPVTILSRCQRYDFKLIASAEIAARLRFVLDAEKVRADDEAIRVLAREAAGSMRDAMSLLDQVIAWAGDEGLSGDGVARVLGVAARSVLHRLGGALGEGDAATCLEIVGDLAGQGFSLAIVARDFLQHLRDLVAAKVGGDPARLGLPEDEMGDLRERCKSASLDDLSRLYLGFSRAFDDIARSAQPRPALEMALVRLARRPPLFAADELLARLGELERRLAGEVRPQAPAPKGGAGPSPADSPNPAPAGPPRPTALAKQARDSIADPIPTAPMARTATADPLATWRAIVDRIAERDARAAAVLDHASALRIEPGRVALRFEIGSFAAAQMTPELIALSEAASSAHFGAATRVEIDIGAAVAEPTVAAARSAERAADLAAAKKRVADDPAVATAIELLGAELRDVRLPE